MNQIGKIELMAAKAFTWMKRISIKKAVSNIVFGCLFLGIMATLYPHAVRAQESAFMATLEAYEKVILRYNQDTSKSSQQIALTEQQVIAPTAQISSTQNWLKSAQIQYNGWLSQVHEIPLSSASTPRVSTYQGSIQNGGSASSIRSDYTQVYGSQPSTSAVSPTVASSVDAADTSANEALTLASTSDVMSQNFINSANSMESTAAATAPGNATMIQSQALVMQLQSSAVLHRLLASMLRQRAERLAEMGADVKRSAADHDAALSSFGTGGGK